MFQKSEILLLLFIFLTLSSFTLSQNLEDWKWVTTIGRKFYVGGTFSKVFQNDGKSLSVSNFAYWDGTQWQKPGGIGTNGPVHAIEVDSCRNIYIGGSFTKMNGIETGPVAKWNIYTRKWEKLGDATFSNTSYVKTIDSDCWNMPNFNNFPNGLLQPCNCDVYIGGKFEIKTPIQTINVAKYDINTKKWIGLKGSGYPYTKDDEVRVLYKRGIPSLTNSDKLLWVGGSFNGGLACYNFANKDWKQIAKLNGPVNAIHYDSSLIYPDTIQLGGEFNQVCAENPKSTVKHGTQCKYLAHYDYNQNKYYSAYGPELLNGPVNSIYKVQNDIYLGGNFTKTNEFNYLAKIKASNQKICRISEFDWRSQLKNPVTDLAVCSSADVGCSEGSVTLCGKNGTLKFYHTKTDSWSTFGKGTDGQVHNVLFAITASGQGKTISVLLFIFVILLSFWSL